MAEIYTKTAMDYRFHKLTASELSYDSSDHSINFAKPANLQYSPVVTTFVSIHDTYTDRIFQFSFTHTEIAANKRVIVYQDGTFEVAVVSPAADTYKAFVYDQVNGTVIAITPDVVIGQRMISSV